jgi:ACS family hexuronate transporter-like MFS transporter
MILTQTTGYVVDHYSYTPILVTAGVLPVVATAALFTLGGRIHQLDRR